jgi:hypothetical protein
MLDRSPFDSLLRHKSARTLLRVEDAANFHFAIRAHHCVGVDLEINGHLAHGRKLIPSQQGSRRNSGLNLIDELAVEGDAAVHIQTEGERAPDWNRCFHAEQWCTSVLVHVKAKLTHFHLVGAF